MSRQKQNKQSDNNKKLSDNAYLKYSGMAFQMAAILFVFAFIGQKLDQRAANESPYFTALMALLGIGVAMYASLKDLIKK